MKLLTFVAIFFVSFGKNKALSKSFKSESLQKAFANITTVLQKQNYVLSIAFDSSQYNQNDLTSLISFADIPHVVAHFDSQSEQLDLNSSAVVLLDSIASVKRFNNRAFMPVTFSMQ